MSDIRRRVMIEVSNTDWGMLSVQKDLIIELAAGKLKELAEQNRDYDYLMRLEGLLSFLDHIQDQAAIVLGEHVVYPFLQNSDENADEDNKVEPETVNTSRQPNDRVEGMDGINAELDRIGSEIARSITSDC